MLKERDNFRVQEHSLATDLGVEWRAGIENISSVRLEKLHTSGKILIYNTRKRTIRDNFEKWLFFPFILTKLKTVAKWIAVLRRPSPSHLLILFWVTQELYALFSFKPKQRWVEVWIEGTTFLRIDDVALSLELPNRWKCPTGGRFVQDGFSKAPTLLSFLHEVQRQWMQLFVSVWFTLPSVPEKIS